MNLKSPIAIRIDRPTTLPAMDWGIGRNPSTLPEPSNDKKGRPFKARVPKLILRDPDYAKLRSPRIKVLDPVPSYADYIRGKGHGSV